jgi:hypothetical protein
MTTQDLKSFDPELLLQELRARESREVQDKVLDKALPCGRVPSAREGIGGIEEPVADLDAFDTTEIVKALRDLQKVIYGTDDRRDMYMVTDRRILKDAESVVALIDTGNIVDNGNGTSTLNGPNFGQRYNLCQNEPFRNQPIIAFCSGFLVDPSIVATAAHCVDNDNLDTVRFVFGFDMIDANTAKNTIDNGEIYRGIRILGRQIGLQGTDWAIVQLDRPVRNRRHVKIRRSEKIPDGSGVHVIGHPTGLPKKFADNAIVRDNAADRYFVANLDTYGGNSGSPVFNSETNIAEGILVRGETDFVWNGNCYVSNVCPANGCRGEDCTRTTEFQSLVPNNEHDFIPFNPETARILRVHGRWKIAVGNMWLLDFGSSRSEAMQALNVIQHYGMNIQCFVGRPNPTMEFYLVDGESPERAMDGENSISFDPGNVEVQYIRGRWKVVDGDNWIMDFDQAESEARQALSYILYYGFGFICFIGHPDSSMTYFRK